MATGIRIKTDEGYYIQAIVYNSQSNVPGERVRLRANAICLWSEHNGEPASPDFHINGIRFYYDPDAKKFHFGNVTASASAGNTSSYAYLFYDAETDKLGFCIRNNGGRYYGAQNISTGYNMGNGYWTYYSGGNPYTLPQALVDIQTAISSGSYKHGTVFYGKSDNINSRTVCQMEIYLLARSDSTWSGNRLDSVVGMYYVQTLLAARQTFGNENVVAYDPYDPYVDIPISEPEEPEEPEYDPNSDPITPQSKPSINMRDCGFVRIYNPTLSELQGLANYLWTDSGLVQNLWNKLKQFVENPMDAFISLAIVPCAIPDGGREDFTVCFLPTGKQLTKAGEQYIEVECGSVEVPKFYASALDYAPYTRISIYLPFIGTQQLDIDDVMGKELTLKYIIDIATGSCVATILVNGSVHYQYSGLCSLQIPFSAADFSGIISAIISTGAMVAGGIAGAAGAVASSMQPEPPHQSTGKTTITVAESTNLITGAVSRHENKRTVVPIPDGNDNTEAQFSHMAHNVIANTVDAVMGSKLIVSHTSSFNGMSGFLSLRYPYVVMEVPRLANPEYYGTYNGRPCLYRAKLGTLSGYTVVQEVQLTEIPATNPELDEIGKFLKGGVIL